MRWINFLWLQFFFCAIDEIKLYGGLVTIFSNVWKIQDCFCMRLTDFMRMNLAFLSLSSEKTLLFIRFNLLKLRSDGSRLNEPLDIIAAIEKSVPFLDAAAAAAAAAAATAAAAAVELPQWFAAPSNMIEFSVLRSGAVKMKIFRFCDGSLTCVQCLQCFHSPKTKWIIKILLHFKKFAVFWWFYCHAFPSFLCNDSITRVRYSFLIFFWNSFSWYSNFSQTRKRIPTNHRILFI